jgi:hypothetical protein
MSRCRFCKQSLCDGLSVPFTSFHCPDCDKRLDVIEASKYFRKPDGNYDIDLLSQAMTLQIKIEKLEKKLSKLVYGQTAD